jgi:DNA helicase IV
MVLMHGICHVSKGGKYGDFSTMILPKRDAFMKVKASHMIVGCIKCCLVYELVDQRDESKPIMEFHKVFIAVKVSVKPLFNNYKASAVIFMARKGEFTGSKDDMRRLKKGILREHLVNNTYSFMCNIKDQTLRLKAIFHPGRQASIEVILEETIGRVGNGPVPY